jgi:hypothetical protein
MSQTASTGPSTSAPRLPGNSSSTLDGALALAALLFGATLLLPWSRDCLTVIPLADRGRFCTDIAGWHGLGGLAGLFAAALLLLWALSAAQRRRRSASRAGRDRMAQTVIALAILALTAGEVVLDRSTLAFGAWIGLLLAVALVVVAFALLARAGATARDRSTEPGPGLG